MAYIPGKPAANDIPAQSQSILQTNSTEINTQFGYDHFAFDSVSNNGKHHQCTLHTEATPSNATGASDIALFCNPSLQLTFARPSGGSTIAMTTSVDPYNGNSSGNDVNRGASWLALGMMIQWGTRTGLGVGEFPVVFGTAFSITAFSVILQVQAGTSSTNTIAYIKNGTVSSTGFTIKVPTGSTVVDDIYWMAIGSKA